MKEVGETSVDGYLTLLEVLLIKVIVIYYIIKGIETSPDVFHMYSIAYNIATDCTLVQFPLCTTYLCRYLTNVLHSIELLLKLFI